MQVGDHLVTPRTGYTHHGLYIGNQQVIHYEGKLGSDAGRITKATLAEFCDGASCSVRDYPLRVYGRKESVERACQRLGEQDYHVILNNCEQFVAWCIMGIGYSEQINELVTLGILGESAVASLKHPVEPIAMAGCLATQSVRDETVSYVIQTVLPANSSLVVNAASTGIAFSSGTTLLSYGFAITSVTPLAMPIAAGVVVGYGIKKVIDWLW